MASNSSISIFQKLEKYSGQRSDDLSAWLRGFERCCVIAGTKTDDDLVKGQLLMLCLCGQALAVAERLEEEKQTPQNFTDLKTKLEAVFNSDADREHKQDEFEKRHININETEDEFMLSLTKLYRSANPKSSEPERCRNVKRKFLSGIPTVLKRNVFVFCNDPHAETVSVENLLEAVRKAKLYISEQEESVESVNVIGSNVEEGDPILKAIEGIKQSLDTHIRSTSEQFNEQSMRINAVADDRSRQSNDGRSDFNGNNDSGREQYQRDGGRSRGRRRQGNQGRRDPPICYNCNQPNHIARDCRAPSGNGRRRLSR